jgi:nucleotide-binding universal stress UspA family protein
MILICYDGSEDSRAAIKRAGHLLRGQPATVLTVWEPYLIVLSHTSFGFVPSVDQSEIDEATRRSAEERAQEGVRLARESGLDAQPLVSPQTTTVAHAILAEADAVSAEAIVMGSRGLTGIKSLLLGSVSHAVLQHADRPVIIVPSPEVADARMHGRQRERGAE